MATDDHQKFPYSTDYIAKQRLSSNSVIMERGLFMHNIYAVNFLYALVIGTTLLSENTTNGHRVFMFSSSAARVEVMSNTEGKLKVSSNDRSIQCSFSLSKARFTIHEPILDLDSGCDQTNSKRGEISVL